MHILHLDSLQFPRHLQYVHDLQYDFPASCFLKLCSKLPPISASAWCNGDNILLTRCSPAGYQYKPQAHSLPNESPVELTLMACCLNAFQMLQSLSFSFPDLLSHTITHSAAALNSCSLKWLGIIEWVLRCGLLSVLMSPDIHGVDLTPTQWDAFTLIAEGRNPFLWKQLDY